MFARKYVETWKKYLKHQLKPLGVYRSYYNTISSNFIANFCFGGHSSVERLLQRAIDKESFEIINKYEKIKNRYRLKIIRNL